MAYRLEKENLKNNVMKKTKKIKRKRKPIFKDQETSEDENDDRIDEEYGNVDQPF